MKDLTGNIEKGNIGSTGNIGSIGHKENLGRKYIPKGLDDQPNTQTKSTAQKARKILGVGSVKK